MVGGVRYALCPASVSHADAADLCVSLGYDGLAEIHSLDEDLAFRELVLAGSPSHHYWIGLTEDGDWTWDSGTPFSYAGWAPREPSGDGSCALFWNDCDPSPDKRLAWNDLPCTRVDETCADMGAACELR